MLDDRFIAISLSKPRRFHGHSWNPIFRVLAPNRLICRHFETFCTREQLLAMQKVEGSRLLRAGPKPDPRRTGTFIRLVESPLLQGIRSFGLLTACEGDAEGHGFDRSGESGFNLLHAPPDC